MPFQLIGEATMTAFDATSIAVECRHIVVGVPARKRAGICLDRVTAPAVVNGILAQVEPAVAHAPFLENRLSKVSHVTGVAPAVSAAVDQQHIERFAVIRELPLLFLSDEFVGRAVADGTAFRVVYSR